MRNSENLLKPDDRHNMQLVKMSIDSKIVELTADVFRLLLYILCFFGSSASISLVVSMWHNTGLMGQATRDTNRPSTRRCGKGKTSSWTEC